MEKALILTQTERSTTVKCPVCRRSIRLHHDAIGEPNDGFGLLHMGEQNYVEVVCLNKDGKRYCEFAGPMQVVPSLA